MVSQWMNSEYMRIVDVYMKVVDELLYKDASSPTRLCAWSKDNTLANFKTMAFKVVLKQKGGLDNYRYYMRIFRTFQWIVCEKDKFSNVQWINGKSVRVVSVEHEQYNLLKEFINKGIYIQMLKKYIAVIDKFIYLNENTEKCLCYWSKEEKFLNVKSENYRLILQNQCQDMNEYQDYLRYFRQLRWIICQSGNFSNVQWLEGKSIRVISIDFEKYKLMKDLLVSC